MNINESKLTAAVETAKAKTTDKRWIAAIDRAAKGIKSGWFLTELMTGVLVTTDSGNTYMVTAKRCECTSANYGKPCAHRAAVRLLEIYNSKEIEVAPVVASTPNAGLLLRPQPKDYRCEGWAV